MKHDVDWTPETIRRFWDNYESEGTYFSELVGRSLLDFIGLPAGTAVDIGCGHGGLVRHLLDRGWNVYAVDQSPESAALVTNTFAQNPRFKGSSVPDQSVDAVFLIEVVEHLNDRALDNAVADARRMLKPDGRLIVTTPNNEDLKQSTVVCPECLARFHKMQHVRSWSAKTLADRLDSYGFRGAATATLLSRWTGPKALLHRLFYRFRGLHPHLVYVGVKR